MPYIGNTSPTRFVSNRAASVYSGDGSTTAFTLEQVVTQDEDVLVSVDGVVQEPSVAYAVSNGTTLTFTGAPSSNAGNNIFVYYLASQVGTVGHPSNQALSATSGTFTGDLDVDSKTLFVDASENKVGVGGETSLLGTLHVRTSDASLTTLNANADDLIIENNGNCGISICSSTSGEGNLNFIDSGDTNIGRIQYSHANNSLSFRANDITAMTIDSIGAVTTPNQPAFLVNKGGTAQSNFSRNSNVTVTFGTEVYDVGANFASNTFTAPVTGKYVLHANVRMSEIDSAATYYTVIIVTSNRAYSNIYDPRGYDQDPVNFSFSESAVADMDAGDTATVVVYQAVGSDGHTSISGSADYTHFGGHLLG